MTNGWFLKYLAIIFAKKINQNNQQYFFLLKKISNILNNYSEQF